MNKIPKDIENKYPKIKRHGSTDYSNKKIGQVTPIYRTKNQGKSIAWLAKCDCGNFTVVRANNLKNNHLTACYECRNGKNLETKTFRQNGVPEEVVRYRKELKLGASADRHGNKYGKLTVLYKTYPKSVSTWMCRCDCGNYEAVRTGYLTEGIKTSCEICKGQPLIPNYDELHFDRIPKESLLEYIDGVPKELKDKYPMRPLGAASNIIGQTFFKLTPIYRTINGVNRDPQYMARCACGGYSMVESRNLSSGATASCGCNSESIGEYMIYQALEKAGIDFKKEYTFDDLTGIDNRTKLRFDAAVFEDGELSYLIEYDGKQHYEDNGFFNSRLEEIQRRDEEKNEYCRKNGIPLIRIPYTKLSMFTLNDIKLGSKYTIK